MLYGHSASVQIQTRHKLDAAAARALLAQAAGVTVIDQASEGDYPTPAAEISGKDDVFVGRIREDASQAQGLNLWLVTDHIRKGTALNMVQIAEVLVRDYL